MELSIHIFSTSQNICKLIRKTFQKQEFNFHCVNFSEVPVEEKDYGEIIDKVNPEPDCIIIDNDIPDQFKDLVVNSFKVSRIVFLPTLDTNENSQYRNITQISEPFKLSELGEILNEIYNKKCEELI